MEEKKIAHTPAETAQALSELAEKLEEMDKADGLFGEAVTDDELEEVAGGKPINPTRGNSNTPSDSSSENNRGPQS